MKAGKKKVASSISVIARDAGVSTSSVSRYFNRRALVSDVLAARIAKAVSVGGFTLNPRRPGPKTAERVGVRNGVVCFLSLGSLSPQEMLKLNAIPVLLHAIERALNERGITLRYAHLRRGGRLPPEVSPRQCDGVILYGRPDGVSAARLARQLLPLPAVWCFREHDDPDGLFDHVFIDNTAVGGLAATFLAGRGHTNTVVFNVDPDHVALVQRVACFTARASALGLQVQVCTPPGGGETLGLPAGFRTLARQYQALKPRPSAAFFCTDSAMLGTLTELRVAGVDTTRMDAIGVDNSEEFLQYLEPRPATIDIGLSRVGQLTVEQLLRRINGDRSDTRTELFVAPEIILGRG